MFKLSEDLMLRAILIDRGSDEYTLFAIMHHISSDAWSVGILLREFSTVYAANIKNISTSLPELEIQYIDYAHWQKEWLQGDVLNEHLTHWTNYLEGIPQVHDFPLDKPRPAVQDYAGQRQCHRISTDFKLVLEQFSQQHNATLFIVLQTAFACFLSRYSGKKDIVMGTPMANRQKAELSELIGFFANTLVLRTNLSNKLNFSQLLEKGKNELLSAYEYQQLPFEKLVDELQPDRNLSYSPLFQIMFVLQSYMPSSISMPNLQAKLTDRIDTVAKFDLTLEIVEDDKGLSFNWEYATSLFKAETIERMADGFLILLKGVIENPDSEIEVLPLLSESQRHHIVTDFNATEKTYPTDKCIHELFEIQAELAPDSIAVIFDQQQLSYAELNVKSNQLAHYLIEQGVKPDMLVGLHLERSLEMIVCLLAIFKAGGAYVPLDPSYPSAR